MPCHPSPIQSGQYLLALRNADSKKIEKVKTRFPGISVYSRRLCDQASYPSFDVRTGSSLVDGDMEIHLRRLDEPHMLHRRAVASINIEASAQV